MTTIATIVKANATVLLVSVKGTDGVENRTFKIEGTSKGVPGQFDKLVDLINQLPKGEFFIEAEKIKGVFKALGENSKDCTTFKFVIACKSWELVQVEKDVWFICRPEGDIVLINGSYVEPTQPQEIVMETKPLTFCQLMKAEWIPSKDTWEAGNLVARMRATWKSGKYATDDRQAAFMKEFVAQVATLPQGEMPNSAFLTAYDIVKERLTGIKVPVEYPETLGKITDDEAVENFEGELPQGNVLTTGTIIPVQGVALPDHLKAFVVKQEVAQEEQDLVNHIHSLEESILKRCESEDELTQESVKADEEELQELYKQLRGTHVQVEEKLPEDDEEMSEGKVTIKNMLGKRYTLEVFFNKDKTLWINTQSGESFNSLSDLCMVHDKEYFSHEFFVEGQPADDTIIRGYQLGDILAVTYDDEHNEYAYYGSDLITIKAVVVEGGFQLGEGEDAEVFATIHELCNKASDGNYEGTPQVRVVTEEEIEAILEKEYNIGMGIE